MLQGLILDLDGVIVDSHPAHLTAWRTLLSSLGKQASDHELDFVLEGHKREDILRHFLGDLTDEQLENYGAQKETLFRESLSEVQTINGFWDFLTQVERDGLPMAVASSASRSRVSYTLEHLDLTGRFQVVVTGTDVAKGKPDPSLFRLAAEGRGGEPSRILVCEDAVKGVEAAKSAGMKCLAIAANGRTPLLQKAGADVIVPDFTATNLKQLRELWDHE